MRPAAGLMVVIAAVLVSAGWRGSTGTWSVAEHASPADKAIRSRFRPPKPAPPIAIDYEIFGDMQIGRPFEIEVSVPASAQLTNVSIRLYGDERVWLSGSTGSRAVARTPRDEAAVSRTVVTPLVGGNLRLNALVEADIAGLRQARHVSIPLRVGSGTQAPDAHGTLLRDASGELLLSLPASGRR